MFLLKSIAVAKNAPSLRSIEASLESIIGDVTQVHLFSEVPQASRVVLQALKPVWLLLEHRLIHLGGLGVLGQLEVTLRDLGRHPGSLEVSFRKGFVQFYGFLALVVCLQLVRFAKVLEQGYQVPVKRGSSGVLLLTSPVILGSGVSDLHEVSSDLLACTVTSKSIDSSG